MKFKAGDKVIRIGEDWSWTIKGETYTVLYVGEDSISLVGIVGLYAKKAFELVQPETTFDLKTEKWFIRTPTPEISAAVQEWLFEQGISWCDGSTQVTATHNKFKFLISGVGRETFAWEFSEKYIPSDAKEIKLTFKTILDTVEYPAPEVEISAEQIQLDCLMQKMQELQEEANKLKAIIEGSK